MSEPLHIDQAIEQGKRVMSEPQKVEVLRAALSQCQKTLAMLIDPEKQHTSVLHAFAAAFASEKIARAALASTSPTDTEK